MSVYDWELSFQACLDQIKALEQGAEIPQSLIAT